MSTVVMVETGRMVVAHFLDGTLVKGTIHDFAPTKETFHLYEGGDEEQGAVAVPASSLKALFFVRSFRGNAERHRDYTFEDMSGQGRKIEVVFVDGEVMRGYTNGYNPKKQGFFLIPADPDGNNTRVFVMSSAVVEVRWL